MVQQHGKDALPIKVTGKKHRVWESSSYFWAEVVQVYDKLIERQMPWLEQATPMYTFVLEIRNRLSMGTTVIKPESFEYYSLSDASLYARLVDDRQRFLEDLLAAESAFEFLSRTIKYHSVPDHESREWRRVKVYS